MSDFDVIVEGAGLAESVAASGESSEVCDKCGKPMIIKRSIRGHFLACSGYPECKNTKSMKGKK